MKLNKQSRKITLIVHDLSSNPIVRAYPFAKALQKLGYEIEIVGFLIKGDKVYEPYRDRASFKTVNLRNPGLFEYLKGLPRLLKLIEGDIVYTFKPRMTSYFVGLLYSIFGIKRDLYLDTEDDELYFEYNGKLDFIYYFFIRGWLAPNTHKYLLFLHLFLFPTKGRTVVSKKLQRRYGGIIVLHGPDEDKFNPDMYDSKECRINFDIDPNKTVILFAGTPHDHKGVDIIVQALSKIDDNEFVFVCAGPAHHPNFQDTKEKLGDKCKLLGSIPNEEMPYLLAASDITPILQKDTKFTESQMPAKLFEAMAMKKIIVSTRASDIGFVLGDDCEEKNKRGYLVEFGNVNEFINVLNSIKNSSKAKVYADNARNYYLNNASVTAISEKLELLFSRS